MKRLAWLCSGCLAALLACGSDNKPADEGVTLTGSGSTALQILPQAAQVLAAVNPPTADLGDMTKFQVDLVDPIKFLLSFGDEASSRMGNSPVTPTNATRNKADYKIIHVDSTPLGVPSQTPGLVVNVLDTNSPKKQTTPTSTGVIALTPPGTFPAGKNLTADAPAFIIPDAFADLLAPLALGAGKTHVDLGAAGYILGFVVDRVAGAPVAGATVAPVPNHTVTHVNLGATGLTAGAATDALGLVLITGPATGTSPITISASSPTLPVCPDPTASTNCLVPASAGLTNNIAFVAPIVKH